MYRDEEKEERKPSAIPPDFNEMSQEEFDEDLDFWNGDADDDVEPSSVKTSLTVKIAAALTVLVFIFLILGNVLSLFTWPSLGFLQESQILNDDPALRGLQQAVVQVLNIGRDHAAFPVAEKKGTGFNIHPSGVIVTNKHLVADADAISVSFEGGGTYQAERWVLSTNMDLALLYLHAEQNSEMSGSSSLPVVELQLERFPEIGDEILVMGSPLGFRRVISRGSVSGYPEFSPAHPVMEIEAPIYPGSSGSPVFDDDNKVVGVVYAAVQQDETESKKGLAVPVFYLLELLEEQY